MFTFPVCHFSGVGNAWSIGNPMSDGKETSGLGTQSAALACGGYSTAVGDRVATVESFNGSSWSLAASLNAAKFRAGTTGSQSAGLAFAGLDTSGLTNTTEEYNGTSWSYSGNLNQSRQLMGCAGTQSAGLTCAGNIGSGLTTASTEEYNGTSWATGNNMNASKQFLAATGLQGAALACGGNDGSELATTEEYDGLNWATANNMNNARDFPGVSGIQSDALVYGGRISGVVNGSTEQYDGLNWSELSDTMLFPVRIFGFAGTGSSTALAFGGYDASNNRIATTQLYTA